jgi:hypothetical protein
MTDEPDEPAVASGVPEPTEPSEPSDSGRHVTDSGRHVTNRNIVPRATAGPAERMAEPDDRDDDWTPRIEDPFDIVTPIRPEPRDVFVDEDVTLSHDEPAPERPAPRSPSRGEAAAARPAAPAHPSNAGDRRVGPDPDDHWSPDEPTHGRGDAPWRPGRSRRPGPGAARRITAPLDAVPDEPDELWVPAALDRGLRIAAIVAVFGLGAAGLAQPGSVLRGGVAWLVFLGCVCAGWGTLVAWTARAADPGSGLRAALGAAGYVAVGGLLLAAGLLTRPVVLALIALGFAGFAWRELTAPAALWRRAADAVRFLRRNPSLGALAGVLAALAALRIVGAVATLESNPWDDDIAYTPFVKRLLDTGDLIEPFSFRRLGAYGGQTVLQALGAARGTLANVQLIDKGLALAIALVTMVGYARERRTQRVWLALIALVVIALPDTAINTASYWTGVVGFLALYRCVVREQWLLVGMVGAAVGTLRQNFIAVVVIFVAGVLVSRLVSRARAMPAREAWELERRAWAQVGGVAAAVIVPWWLAAYASNQTFLFPIMRGTWNHALSLSPSATSWTQELAALVTGGLETTPIVVMPLLALAVVFVADRRLGRPLTALAIACALGFGLVVHSLAGGETFQLWRYAFGFTTALTLAFVIEIGAGDDAHVSLAPLARWIVLAALVLQLVVGRGGLGKQAIGLVDNLREAAAIDRNGDPSARAEQRRYAAMQAAIPRDAAVVVMLDDPALLDYRHQVIANLDVPGLASPGPQLPAFTGAEPLRAYLVAQGYRYVAFVRSERSRYCFRRAFWLWRMFNDLELFRIMSAYQIDMIDNLAELATTTRKLYDDDGLVVLDLAAPLRAASWRPAVGDEPTRRTAWTRELAAREGLRDAWSLTSRADLRFEHGFGELRYIDASIADPKWYELSRPAPEPVTRGTAVLPIQRRGHLRVRGTTAMRLVVRAEIALNAVLTHPRLDVSLDGELVASAVADPAGRYAIDVTVPRDRLGAGWSDLYLVFSSLAEPDRNLRDVRIARLLAVEWAPP